MGASDLQELLADLDKTAIIWLEKGYFHKEQPSHSVTLQDYYTGKYTVTVGEDRAFIAAGGYRFSQFWTSS